MSVLPETPAHMHRSADRLRASAAGLRERASLLGRAAEATRWYSPAAAEFKGQVHAVSRHMYAAADRLDHAAQALDDHARRVHDIITAPARAVDALVGLVT